MPALLAALCAALVLALAACAAPTPSPTPSPVPEPASPAGASDKESGAKEARPGERFTIALDANATTGFQWSLEQPLDDKLVRLIGSEYQQPAPSGQPRVGQGGRSVWTFEAQAPGTGTIVLRYSQPWARSDPSARLYTLTLTVR